MRVKARLERRGSGGKSVFFCCCFFKEENKNSDGGSERMTPALKRLEGDRKRIAKCTGEGRREGRARERWREGGREAHWQRMRGAEGGGGGGVWLRRRSERD